MKDAAEEAATNPMERQQHETLRTGTAACGSSADQQVQRQCGDLAMGRIAISLSMIHG